MLVSKFSLSSLFPCLQLLKKTYEVSPDLLEEKAPELNTVEGTEIEWKPGMNLCVTETKKKQKAKSGRNAGQVRSALTTLPLPDVSSSHLIDLFSSL